MGAGVPLVWMLSSAHGAGTQQHGCWCPTPWVPVVAPGPGPCGYGATGTLGRHVIGTARGNPETAPVAGAVALWGAPLPMWVWGTESLEGLGHAAGRCRCWVPHSWLWWGVFSTLAPMGWQGCWGTLGGVMSCEVSAPGRVLPHGCSPGCLRPGAGLRQLPWLHRLLLCAGCCGAGGKSGQGSCRAAGVSSSTRS